MLSDVELAMAKEKDMFQNRACLLMMEVRRRSSVGGGPNAAADAATASSSSHARRPERMLSLSAEATFKERWVSLRARRTPVMCGTGRRLVWLWCVPWSVRRARVFRR